MLLKAYVIKHWTPWKNNHGQTSFRARYFIMLHLPSGIDSNPDQGQLLLAISKCHTKILGRIQIPHAALEPQCILSHFQLEDTDPLFVTTRNYLESKYVHHPYIDFEIPLDGTVEPYFVTLDNQRTPRWYSVRMESGFSAIQIFVLSSSAVS